MRKFGLAKLGLVTRVVADMGNDPDMTALALAKSKLTMASDGSTTLTAPTGVATSAPIAGRCCGT